MAKETSKSTTKTGRTVCVKQGAKAGKVVSGGSIKTKVGSSKSYSNKADKALSEAWGMISQKKK